MQGFSRLVAFLVIGCFSLVLWQCHSSKPTAQELSFPDLTGLEAEAKQTVEAHQSALTSLLKGTPNAEEKAAAYGKLGMLYFAFGFHPQAKTCFENAILSQPEYPQWHYYLGRLPQKDTREKQAALEKVLEFKPQHVASIVALADIHLQAGRKDKAAELYQKALAIDPYHPLGNYQLGTIAFSEKRYEDARAHFKKTLDADPRASATHYQLALLAQELGEKEVAEAHMQLRGDRLPTLNDPLMNEVMLPSALAHYRLAESLRLSLKHNDAVMHYDQAVELLPQEISPRMGRVLNFVQSNRHGEALSRLRDDLLFFPNNAVLLHILARLLAASPDDEVRDGQKALQLLHLLGKGQVNAEMVETLAMAFAETGDFDQAISYQKRALSVTDETDPTFYQRLQENLANYEAKKPCRLPWQAQDPIFLLNTYAAMELMSAQQPKGIGPEPTK